MGLTTATATATAAAVSLVFASTATAGGYFYDEAEWVRGDTVKAPDYRGATHPFQDFADADAILSYYFANVDDRGLRQLQRKLPNGVDIAIYNRESGKYRIPQTLSGLAGIGRNEDYILVDRRGQIFVPRPFDRPYAWNFEDRRSYCRAWGEEFFRDRNGILNENKMDSHDAYGLLIGKSMAAEARRPLRCSDDDIGPGRRQYSDRRPRRRGGYYSRRFPNNPQSIAF